MATFTDIRGDFRRNPVTGDIDLIEDEESISNAIKNIVFINKNEVVFNSRFGAAIESELFEPLTIISARSIQDKIKNALSIFEDRIERLDVRVNTLPTEDGYDVTIKYLPRKNIEEVVINFFLERSV